MQDTNLATGGRHWEGPVGSRELVWFSGVAELEVGSEASEKAYRLGLTAQGIGFGEETEP